MDTNQRDRRARHSNEPRPVENEARPVENEAPDGGWGWFCVLGCAIAHMIMGGFSRASGILYLILQEQFGRSASVTAWIISISDTVHLLSSPLSSALCNRFSCRLTVIVGAILYSVSFVLLFLVPKFEFIFFSLSFLSGIGRSLCYTPSLIIVGLYFNKRRSLATGLGTTGTGIGGLFMPPLLGLLYREYGFAGAILIIGGFVLNITIAGALYRPLDANKKITEFARNRQLRMKGNTEDIDSSFLNPDTKNGNMYKQKLESVDNVRTVKDDDHTIIDSMDDTYHVTDIIVTEQLLDAVHVTGNMVTEQPPDAEHVEEFAKSLSSPDKTNKRSKQPKNKLFEFSLLRNQSFLLVCLSSFCVMLAMKSSLVFIPALAKQNGLSDIKAALILSIMGGTDLLSRFTAGILDHKRIRKYRLWICNVALAICSVMTFLFTVATTFAGYGMITSIIGVCLGLYVSQSSVIVVDILGAGKLMTSFGILNFFRGFGMLIGPPISGLFRDILGSFTEAYYFSGALFFISALLMLGSNVILERQRNSRTKP